MKKLLFLGASRYYLKSIEAIKSYGYKIIVIDKNPQAEGFRVADESAHIDIIDKKKVYSFAKDKKIDGILAVNDYGVQTAAFVAERLNLVSLSYQTAKIVTDKALMRKIWKENNVPVPDFFVTEDYNEAKDNIRKLEFPVILKPADSRGGGSRGVKVIFSKEELKETFSFAQSFYEDKRVIIEKCIKGSEHNIEVAVIDKKVYILAISEKIKTPYPYRVDKKVIYPANISISKFDVLKETIEKALRSLGFENGVAHIELALTDNGPILFEIGGRCGGGATPQIVEAYTGIPYLKIATKIAMNEPIDEEELHPNFEKGAVYHFFVFQPGYVERIKGDEIVNRIKEIQDFELLIVPPTKIKEVRTGADRHGFAVIVAEDRKKALEISNHLDRMIVCEYKKEK